MTEMGARWRGITFAVSAVVMCSGTAWAHDLRLTVAGGVAIPTCEENGPCEGTLRQGPSLEAMGLVQPTRNVGLGLMARAWRVGWDATFPAQIPGAPPGTVQSTLTSLFLGGAVRVTPMPYAGVQPIVTMALGVALQWQTGSNYECNGPYLPTGQLGLGGSAPIAPRYALFAMAIASLGMKTDHCAVIDGPPATPAGVWGFGLQAGLAFDLSDHLSAGPPE